MAKNGTHLTIDRRNLEILIQIAEREGRSKSSIVNQALKVYFDTDG